MLAPSPRASLAVNAMGRPSPHSRQVQVVRCMAKNSVSKVGFRYDKGNLRWVRDDRFAGQNTNVIMKPKTGGEYTVWPAIHYALKDAGLKEISIQEAQSLQSKGWTIADVRLPGDFDQQHAKGAVSVPLYRYVQGDDFWSRVKKVVMASFAMKATERNTDFIADALAGPLKKNQKIIVVCSTGGTLDTNVKYRREKRLFADPDRAFGRESRSLKAAHEFLLAGWNSSNMVHMEGGLQQWRYEGLPMSGTDFDGEDE